MWYCSSKERTKPGFVTDQPEYEVEVSEGGNTEFKVVMAPYNDYTITSEPNYCKVYLDGEYAGTTPLNLTVREGEHLLRLEKNGYYPVEKFITPALDGEAKQLSFVMDNAYPLLVTADKGISWRRQMLPWQAIGLLQTSVSAMTSA